MLALPGPFQESNYRRHDGSQPLASNPTILRLRGAKFSRFFGCSLDRLGIEEVRLSASFGRAWLVVVAHQSDVVRVALLLWCDEAEGMAATAEYGGHRVRRRVDHRQGVGERVRDIDLAAYRGHRPPRGVAQQTGSWQLPYWSPCRLPPRRQRL